MSVNTRKHNRNTFRVINDFGFFLICFDNLCPLFLVQIEIFSESILGDWFWVTRVDAYNG